MEELQNEVKSANLISNTNEKSTVRKNKKSQTPTDDINLAALALRVANKWADYPNLNLIFINQADTLLKAQAFNTLVQQRVIEIQNRPTVTRSVQEIITDVKFGISIVRNYLLEKYKDKPKAMSYYTDFGLEKKNKTWAFPTDQQRLLVALNQTKQGIITHGFVQKDYGTAFWTTAEADLTAAIQNSISSDGSSATTVSQKEQIKQELKQIMTSLRFVIRANYPTTYNAILRDFGFQKEKN